MKKTLIILTVLCAGMANAATVLFDFNASLLDPEGSSSISTTIDGITATVVGTNGGNLRSANNANPGGLEQ